MDKARIESYIINALIDEWDIEDEFIGFLKESKEEDSSRTLEDFLSDFTRSMLFEYNDDGVHDQIIRYSLDIVSWPSIASHVYEYYMEELDAKKEELE